MTKDYKTELQNILDEIASKLKYTKTVASLNSMEDNHSWKKSYDYMEKY